MRYAETYLFQGQSVFSHSIVLETFTFTCQSVMCISQKKEPFAGYRINVFHAR
jgi:hypothetical protein